MEVAPHPHRGGAVWDRVIDRHVEVLVFSDVMVYVAHHLPHPCAIEIPSNNVAPPPTYTHTSADRLSLSPHHTCCPTFDILAVVEVDVLEFGFVLEGVQAA